MQMPSTPWSIMQSSTRRWPSRSRSKRSVNGVGAIGKMPVYGAGLVMGCARGRKAVRLQAEEEARHVEEDRRGERHRVHPVQHAAVAIDHRAPVLDAAVALDCREDQAAEEAEYGDEERHERRLPHGERRDPV